jgi:ubiquinone/menaquinone biosynthesis C-methylase UbiE
MKRTENEQLNSPEYWDAEYRKEMGSGKARFDYDRLDFVLNQIRDVAQYFPDATGLTFLDAGCGSAELLNHVHAIFPMWKKSGLDFSPEVIKFCQKYNPQFSFRCADVCNTGYRDQEFFAVNCMETLEHVDDPEEAVSELARITRERGNLCVSVPFMEKNNSDEHVWLFTVDDVFNLLKPYGDIVDFKIAAGGLSICASCKIPAGHRK